MKKYLYLALALTFALVSCKKEASVSNDNKDEAVEERTPIEFVSNFRPAVLTKSLGALEHWNQWQKLYIYGIAREGLNSVATAEQPLDFSTDATTGDYTGILINNVQAEPLNATDTNGDNTNDFDVNTITRQQIMVLNKDVTPNENFFYSEDRRYEFFGYYVDDASQANDATSGAPTPTIGADDITLPVKINGAQDLMLATTDHEEDNVEDINPNRLYSAYSSRKGIKPNLIFQHQLSRFNVYVKAGGNDVDLAKKVTITTLQVETNDEGIMHIAYKDHVANKPQLEVTEKDASSKDIATGVLTPGQQAFVGIWGSIGPNYATDEDIAYLDDTGGSLKQLDNSLTDKYTRKLVVAANNTFTTPWRKAGTVMVMPGKDEYMLKIGIVQEGYGGGNTEAISYYPVNFANIIQANEDPKNADTPNTDWDYSGVPDLDLDSVAQPGHQYDVNIIVYGLQEVKIEVSMTPWEQNGSFNIDPDRDTEIAITTNADQYNKTSPKELVVGETFQITATTTPANQPVTYESANPEVATVSAEGLVTAVAASDKPVKIMIKSAPTATRPEGGYTAAWFKVNPAPALTLTITSATAVAMKTLDAPVQAAWTVTDAQNNAVADATIECVSSDPGVVTVTNAGEITAVAAGTATITVTASKTLYASASAEITVTVTTSPKLIIDVTSGLAANLDLTAPAGYTIVCAISDDATNVVNGASITYASDNEAVATVDANGNVTAVAAGTANITINAQKVDYYDADPVVVVVTVQ